MKSEDEDMCGRSHVALWLFSCCAMIFVMALLGAVTRLTESGLSITEWNPIMGALPPLTNLEWQRAFLDYQNIPQYKILHQGMTLSEFQIIFFWEWVHRLWGRLIGVVFVIPLMVLWARHRITRGLAIRLMMVLAFGMLQGFIGWFMVQSGLEVRTSVSPYRLALHLSCALILYAALLWTALDYVPRPDSESFGLNRHLCRHGMVALFMLVTTMVWGAFVAGLHAGEAYNTWPLMEGDVLPSAAFTIRPLWLNVFENLALVQFIHRWLGPCSALVLGAWVVRVLRASQLAPFFKRWALALGVMAVFQVMLGLATLLSHVNLLLGTLHQAGAITLLTLLLINLYYGCTMGKAKSALTP